MAQTRQKNVILSIKGTELTQKERKLFVKHQPLGIILFARNIEDAEQLTKLCADVQNCLKNQALIMIDQEGGRVKRIKNFGVSGDMKSAKYFGDLAANGDLEQAKKELFEQSYQAAAEMLSWGINVICAPIADLYYDFANKAVMGDRCFSHDPKIVAELCTVVDQAFARAGVQSIMKHIPGHGQANVDSHYDLPVVENDITQDSEVFRDIGDIKMAMTAHIIYKTIDPDACATVSQKCYNYIRNHLNYKGIIISDDLNMKALPHDSPADNFKDILASQTCEIGLYCHGNYEEMVAVAECAGPISEELQQKINDLNINFNLRAASA